ncbi:hypothetical protein BST97_15195 [Nonlabens spongiae]|uniref:Leucine-binding protein domain-containing protein n=1 Tax=Nonlabens spongiae TaxID=331648 RepID=A0A1W6MNP6_9FLAO|nr:ABC transporter substrate-binding protein [Nonlabens spongiae]ARN79221.1 hypothetical protein BST97_15195 [Nonlabens spongiae]
MAKSLDIGLMMPYSSIYPMGKLFKNGLIEILDHHKDEIDYTLHQEFVGPASIEEVNKADDKHASYNDVDIVSGIVNSRTVAEASASFKKGTQYHFANLGEHLYDQKRLPDHVAIESRSIWKEVYALTNYAYNSISKNGAYAASFYDTGYAYAQMVDVALKDNGKKDFLPVLVSQIPPPGQPSNVEEVVDRIERLMPDWIFAAFCGSEATRFLKAFYKKGLHKKIKLLGLSFFSEKLLELDTDEVAVLSVLETTEDSLDISEYNKNHFYNLGRNSARSILLQNGIESQNQKTGIGKSIFSCKMKDAGGLYLEKVQSAKQIKMNNKHIQEILKQPASVWQNPYMCI